MTLKLHLEIIMNPGQDTEDSIGVSNYTSQRFTKLLLGDVPPSITATLIKGERSFKKKLKKSVQENIDAVNNCSGWNLTGWCRRGFVPDEGAAPAEGEGAPKISSTDLYHHASSIKINGSPTIDRLSFDTINLKPDDKPDDKKGGDDQDGKKEGSDGKIDGGNKGDDKAKKKAKLSNSGTTNWFPVDPVLDDGVHCFDMCGFCVCIRQCKVNA